MAKFSPAGKLLVTTYLAGQRPRDQRSDEIAADAQGNVVIAGSTSATDFPVTPGVFQPKNAETGGKFPYDGVVSILSKTRARSSTRPASAARL